MEVFRSVWLFFQDQILGMKWLSIAIQNGLSALGLDTTSRFGGSMVTAPLGQFTLQDRQPMQSSLRTL